ncbi:MAG: VirB3 family type IV secretion system protein [Pasteurella sp.]|nr:VirB3 family type IV secretion system protein [Pasteurella sp.]
MAVQKTEAPLFRGATKPPMIAGVPLLALGYMMLPVFIGVGLSIFIGQWGYLLFFVPVILFPIAREMTKKDDQYLKLMSLELSEKIEISSNKVNSNYVIPPKTIRRKDLI